MVPRLRGRFGRPYVYAEVCPSTQRLLGPEHPEGAVAVADAGGQVLAQDAESCTVDGMPARIRTEGIADLAARAKARHLTADDLRGATFTITNVGSYHYVLAGSFSPDGTSIVFATDEDARLVANLLRGEGYSTAEAGSADAALEQLASSPVDIVVSDWKLPGRDGMELLRDVKARFPETAFVMVPTDGGPPTAHC